MFAESRIWTPDETGGMLVGYRVEEAGIVACVVTHLIDAGPGATRDRRRFVPDGSWQQKELEAVYYESGHVATYLGDWHSHPHGGPSPSPTDRTTYERVANDPDTGTMLPLVVIVSPGRGADLGAFWIGRDGTCTMLNVVPVASLAAADQIGK
jgi:integrative and conjugative element protein (TIGR02256 family)